MRLEGPSVLWVSVLALLLLALLKGGVATSDEIIARQMCLLGT